MIGFVPETPLEHTLARLCVGQVAPNSLPEALWPELIPLAIDHQLGPMLAWVLQKEGWPLKSDARWEPLVTSSRQAFLHFLALDLARRRFASALDQAEIPAIWLKGIGLAHTVYPAPHLRPMLDLDVLLPPDRMIEARQIAAQLAYQSTEIDFAALLGFADSVRHHDHLVGSHNQVQLELHFRLLIPDLQRRMRKDHITWFWQQTQPAKAKQTPFLILKPEASLLHLCAHAILQHSQAPLSLLHLLDLHLLITKYLLDWDLIIRQAVDLHWTYAVERALGLAQACFETPLPGRMLSDLRDHRPVDDCTPQSVENQAGEQRWKEWKWMFQNMALRQRLQLVRLTLFPPAAFLRQIYEIPPEQPLFFSYLRHWLDGGSEAARALGHLLL